MSRYPSWPTTDQGNIVGARLANELYHRFTGGLNALSFTDQRDAALAELLATTGEVFNVKSFGAKGDGVTDDSAAFQTAIDRAFAASLSGGAEVFVPPTASFYRINTTLVFPTSATFTGVHMRGVGRGSRLEKRGAGDLIRIGVAAGGGGSAVTLDSLYLGGETGVSGNGVVFGSGVAGSTNSQHVISNCTIIDHGGVGIFVRRNTFVVSIMNCLVSGNTSHGLHAEAVAQLRVIGGYYFTNGGDAIRLDGTLEFFLAGLTVSNSVNGLHVLNCTLRANMALQIHSEGNTDAGILIDGSRINLQSCTVVNNNESGNSSGMRLENIRESTFMENEVSDNNSNDWEIVSVVSGLNDGGLLFWHNREVFFTDRAASARYIRRFDRANVSTIAELASGNNNNFDLGSAIGADTLLMSANSGGSSLTGMQRASSDIEEQFGETGLRKRIINTANTLTLEHQHGSSNANARFLSSTGADVVLAADGMVDIEYDQTAQRWRIFGAP